MPISRLWKKIFKLFFIKRNDIFENHFFLFWGSGKKGQGQNDLKSSYLSSIVVGLGNIKVSFRVHVY